MKLKKLSFAVIVSIFIFLSGFLLSRYLILRSIETEMLIEINSGKERIIVSCGSNIIADNIIQTPFSLEMKRLGGIRPSDEEWHTDYVIYYGTRQHENTEYHGALADLKDLVDAWEITQLDDSARLTLGRRAMELLHSKKRFHVEISDGSSSVRLRESW